MIRTSYDEQGGLLRVTLASPRANILDIETLDAIGDLLHDHAELPAELRGILIDHDGPDFSFGAAVAEHLPDRVEAMLHAFGRAIRAVVHAPVPVIAAVDGRCLGGGMELALAAHVLVANREAVLGQPEIVLGVLPPVAVALLPWRAPILRRMVLTGESLDAATLAAAGLVDLAVEGPAADAALDFHRRHFADRSGFSLRQVTRAADPGDVFDQALYQAEQLYLQKLMKGADPVEGLQAFLDRRKPTWRHA